MYVEFIQEFLYIHTENVHQIFLHSKNKVGRITNQIQFAKIVGKSILLFKINSPINFIVVRTSDNVLQPLFTIRASIAQTAHKNMCNL